jgi:hypothetical protein
MKETPVKTTIEWTIAAALGRTNPGTGSRRPRTHSRGRGDLGEGVISAAIAVLIMAFLGAAMWVGFQKMWKSTESTTNQKVEQIGQE